MASSSSCSNSSDEIASKFKKLMIMGDELPKNNKFLPRDASLCLEALIKKFYTDIEEWKRTQNIFVDLQVPRKNQIQVYKNALEELHMERSRIELQLKIQQNDINQMIAARDDENVLNKSIAKLAKQRESIEEWLRKQTIYKDKISARKYVEVTLKTLQTEIDNMYAARNNSSAIYDAITLIAQTSSNLENGLISKQKNIDKLYTDIDENFNIYNDARNATYQAKHIVHQDLMWIKDFTKKSLFPHKDVILSLTKIQGSEKHAASRPVLVITERLQEFVLRMIDQLEFDKTAIVTRMKYDAMGFAYIKKESIVDQRCNELFSYKPYFEELRSLVISTN